MGNLDPLPLRTCSRCEHWVREYAMTDEDDKIKIKAVCVLLRMRKYGSDTCSRWTRK
jgi:hypothetical protein